jgi:hypothetical protein
MSSTAEWEVVGVIDASAAAHARFDDETIIVEHDDPTERLIAVPKTRDEEGS